MKSNSLSITFKVHEKTLKKQQAGSRYIKFLQVLVSSCKLLQVPSSFCKFLQVSNSLTITIKVHEKAPKLQQAGHSYTSSTMVKLQ